MIKSKLDIFGFWFLFLFGLFFAFLIVSATSQYQFGHTIMKMQIRSNWEYYFNIGLAFFGLLIMFSILWFNVKNIRIEKDKKEISFQNIFTRSVTTYNFSDFDGYIDTFVSHGKLGSTYKTIGLVQGNKVVRRIDSYYYSNYEKLKEQLTECNYLGEYNFGFWDSIKMLLNKEVL